MSALTLRVGAPRTGLLVSSCEAAPPSVRVSISTSRRAKTICRSHYAQDLLPAYSLLPETYSVGSYEDDADVRQGKFHPVSVNKYRLTQAFNACGVPEERRAMMLAMAMQESAHMDARDRDAGKDLYVNGKLDKAANCTAFNLSVDIIEQTGYFGCCHDLTNDQWCMLISDTDQALETAVRILMCAFDKWGVENTLAFVRQGRSGFDPQKTTDWRSFVSDGVRRNIMEYLDCMKTYLAYIDTHPEVIWNQRRPNIYCTHI